MWDWLFGKPIEEVDQTQLTMRPQVLEPDTIVEAAALLEKRVGEAKLFRDARPGESGGMQEVPLDGFTTLHDTRLRDLLLRGRDPQSRLAIYVNLRAYDQPAIYFDDGDERFLPLAYELAERLVREGRTRVPRRFYQHLLPAGVVLSLVGLWIWTWIVEQPSVSTLLLGWVGVSIAAAFVIERYRSVLRPRWDRVGTGHRIRPISRYEHRMQGLDTRTKVKVAVYTALVALPLSVVGTLIVQALTGP